MMSVPEPISIKSEQRSSVYQYIFSCPEWMMSVPEPISIKSEQRSTVCQYLFSCPEWTMPVPDPVSIKSEQRWTVVERKQGTKELSGCGFKFRARSFLTFRQ